MALKLEYCSRCNRTTTVHRECFCHECGARSGHEQICSQWSDGEPNDNIADFDPPLHGRPYEKRIFDSGATRDTADNKFDYEGFLSPYVITRFAAYMHENRKMKDGSMRESDNWQKGIPVDQYMKSAFRHFMMMWLLHRENAVDVDDFIEAACGVLFNVMGYMHEVLKK